jgi:hypothetical protein
MVATPEQAQQLAVLDRLAVLVDVDGDLQAVITRLANRARTDEEGNDVALLIRCRGRLREYRALVARCHKDSQT